MEIIFRFLVDREISIRGVCSVRRSKIEKKSFVPKLYSHGFIFFEYLTFDIGIRVPVLRYSFDHDSTVNRLIK